MVCGIQLRTWPNQTTLKHKQAENVHVEYI